MFLTLLLTGQLLLAGQKPVAVFHQTQPQGIVLTQPAITPVATFKVTPPTPVAVFHYQQPKGIPLTAPKITPIATFKLQ